MIRDDEGSPGLPVLKFEASAVENRLLHTVVRSDPEKRYRMIWMFYA